MADFLQEDVLELRVGQIEKIADPFPRLGMFCEVPSCHVDTHFKRWEDYTRHYVSYHKQFRQKPRCSVCEREFPNRRNTLRHIKTVHGGTGLVQFLPVKNRIFIDLKGIPLPDQTKPLLVDWTKPDVKEYIRACQKEKRKTFSMYKSLEKQSSIQLREMEKELFF